MSANRKTSSSVCVLDALGRLDDVLIEARRELGANAEALSLLDAQLACVALLTSHGMTCRDAIAFVIDACECAERDLESFDARKLVS